MPSLEQEIESGHEKTTQVSNIELLCSEQLRTAIQGLFTRLYLKAMAAPKDHEAETDEEKAVSSRARATRELHRVVGLVARRVTAEA